MTSGAAWSRITSFSGKELRETLRRPGMLFALVLGPFLVMLALRSRLHAASDSHSPLRSSSRRDPPAPRRRFYQGSAPGRIQVTAVTDDPAGRHCRLENLETDLVVVAPENAAEQLRKGEQTEIRVGWNQVDPVYDGLARLAVSTMVSALNAEIIRQAAARGSTWRRASWPAGREPVAGRHRRAHHGRDPERGAHRAQRPQLLRSGGAGARHPAPGHHPQRAVDGA